MTSLTQEVSYELAAWDKSKLIAMQDTASKVVGLMNSIGRNADDLPIAYVDTGIVLEHASLTPLEEVLRDPPEGSFIPLSYVEGFATTPDGVPFWERLDGEPLDYYKLFKAYRDMLYLKMDNGDPAKQQAFEKYHEIDHERSFRSLRSLYAIANRSGINKQVMKTIHQLYHWPSRVKAYDIYRQQVLEATREFELQRMQSAHSKAARAIFETCMEFIDNHHDELNPKTALEWFQTAVELERLALGMPKDKPATDENSSMPSTLIQINQNSQNSVGTVNQQNNSHGTKARETRIVEVLNILRESQAADAVLASGVHESDENQEPHENQDDEEDIIDVDC